jgi:hypothetical protein
MFLLCPIGNVVEIIPTAVARHREIDTPVLESPQPRVKAE